MGAGFGEQRHTTPPKIPRSTFIPKVTDTEPEISSNRGCGPSVFQVLPSLLLKIKQPTLNTNRTHIQNCRSLTCPTAGFLGELGLEVERNDVASESSLEDSRSCVGE